MINSEKNKLAKLLDSSILSQYTTIENLQRLVFGNLSHIGDAILEGKTIMLEGNKHLNFAFSRHAGLYSIEQKKIKFGSIEVNEPYREMPESGTDYFAINLHSNLNIEEWSVDGCGYDIDRKLLKSGFMFKTKEDAVEVCNEMIRMMGGEV